MPSGAGRCRRSPACPRALSRAGPRARCHTGLVRPWWMQLGGRPASGPLGGTCGSGLEREHFSLMRDPGCNGLRQFFNEESIAGGKPPKRSDGGTGVMSDPPTRATPRRLEWTKSPTSWRYASGSSTQVKWPAPGITPTVALVHIEASCPAHSAPNVTSRSPVTMSVGARTSDLDGHGSTPAHSCSSNHSMAAQYQLAVNRSANGRVVSSQRAK